VEALQSAVAGAGVHHRPDVALGFRIRRCLCRGAACCACACNACENVRHFPPRSPTRGSPSSIRPVNAHDVITAASRLSHP
jgi:hypothetical protein